MKRKVPGLEPLETLPIVNEGEVGVYREREEEVVKQSRCESERVQKGGGGWWMKGRRERKRRRRRKKEKRRGEKEGQAGRGSGLNAGRKERWRDRGGGARQKSGFQLAEGHSYRDTECYSYDPKI